MQPNQNSYSSVIVLAVICLFTVIGVWQFGLIKSDLSVHQIAEAEGQFYGGNDWVKWKDTPDGVVADAVHPLIESNEFLRDRYIKKGDRLISIEFIKVNSAAMVNDLVQRFPTGKPVIYWVERDDPLSISQNQKDIVLQVSYVPRFSFHEKPLLWSLFPWMAVPGGFLCLVSLLIVFPILRPKIRENWPELAVLVMGLLMFVALLVRHTFLLVQTEYLALGFERLFTSTFLVMLALYPLFFLLNVLKGKWQWLVLIPAIAAGLVLVPSIQEVNSGQFWIYDDLIMGGAMVFFLGWIFAALAISVLEKWKSRSRMDKAFHILSLVYVALLIPPYLGWKFLPFSEEFNLFLGLGALYIPMISSAASQLKFGKVSLVLNYSLQYTFFAAFALGAYFLIDVVLASLGVKFKYQNFLEVAILIFLALFVRGLFRVYQDKLRRYFILSQQSKLEQINRFISLIPQYSSSHKLLLDLTHELKEYFGTDKIVVWVRGEEIVGSKDVHSEAFLADLFETLKTEGAEIWGRNKQLSSLNLPEVIESELESAGMDLVNILLVRNEIEGLILVGKKKRGVYNLGDMEIISRVVQQTRLTLSVLHLLEREKLLMEKNYEANLTALRSQINPHFLFNTLNTISSLIHEEPDEAEEGIEKLAYIFRYTLKHSSQNLVTLKNEMSLVKTYLEIEKLRFGDRMEIRYEIEPLMEEVQLPAFVIQTIIENSVKHGIGKIIEKGLIIIEVWSENGFMYCEIYDNGPGIDLAKVHTSTGLNNILTRLEQIYQMKNLLYFENTGNGTRVTLKIPIQHDQTQSSDRG